jgi:hypothetical protein
MTYSEQGSQQRRQQRSQQRRTVSFLRKPDARGGYDSPRPDLKIILHDLEFQLRDDMLLTASSKTSRHLVPAPHTPKHI